MKSQYASISGMSRGGISLVSPSKSLGCLFLLQLNLFPAHITWPFWPRTPCQERPGMPPGSSVPGWRPLSQGPDCPRPGGCGCSVPHPDQRAGTGVLARRASARRQSRRAWHLGPGETRTDSGSGEPGSWINKIDKISWLVKAYG